MDFTISPKGELHPNSPSIDIDMNILHPDYETRCKFYDTVLVPTGHAFHPRDNMWQFSDEFFYALKNELPFLQAWLKLIL
jgi:hypothetical protein